MSQLVKELISPILELAKQRGQLYHFTSLQALAKILNSNILQASPDLKVSSDDGPVTDFYYFSTTRDKFLYKKNPKIASFEVRLVLDGDKLSSKYKIEPYYYYYDEMIDEPAPKHDQDESEERIVLKNSKEIPNASNYITKIQILIDNIDKDKIDEIKYLVDKYPNIEILNKEKSINLDTPILNESMGNFDFKKALQSLTKYMLDNGMNIKPLPKLILINNDIENANNILGKTAYYNPSNCSITLYTLNRHPKDILRSYAHEMIHRIQDNENRLNNINTTNTNEGGDLDQLEREAYEHGNMTFRNWEDNIKNQKYNYTPKLSNKIFSQLHELKINEITLNPNNAVEVYGDLDNGDFTVGEYDYNYRIIKLDSNPYNSNSFYNIDFHEIGNKSPNPSLPTGNAKENYIKILSTMYKIILDFTQNISPEYIGISSLDESGYWNVYNNLTKTNQIPGYSRKDVGLQFKDRNGKNGKFIILKRKDV
jgi:hypothetical protein